ncbi:MAG: DUF4251 domain-containing protein [Reichenbachiella sp.]
MRSLVLILLLLLGLVVVVYGQDRKAKKKEAQQEAYLATKEIIESGAYGFEATWATTQKGRRINLIGNGNSFVMEDGYVTANFPYFGVSQVPSMTGNGGITMNGEIKDLEVKYKDKKMKMVVSFKTNDSETNEGLTVFINIGKGGNVSMSVSSTNRSRISYDGELKVLEKEKE